MIKKNKGMHGVPVISNALISVFEDLEANKKCPISKYLRNLNAIPAKVKHHYMCDIFSAISFKCEDNNVLFSFIPENKLGDESSSSRQVSTPSKVVNTLINDKRPTVKTTTVKVDVPIQDKDGNCVTKSKNFWLDEKEGVAYNDAENLFELQIDGDLEQSKSANKQFTLFKTDEYEAFANYIKNNFLCNFEFKILRGDDIAKYYHYSTYFKSKGQKGTLWGSCMREQSPERFAYYTENPESIGLLVAMFEGKVLGRALVWTSTKGLVMDRIYSYEDFILQSFIDYAEQNHITYKAHYQSAGNEGDWMVYNEKTNKYEKKSGYRIEIIIKRSFSYYNNYPYIDTFFCSPRETFKQIDGNCLLTNYRWISPNTGESSGGNRYDWGLTTPEALIEL